jgi:hypothetical protein
LREGKDQKELSHFDLIWICSTPEMQLISIKKLLQISAAKILVEKPISSFPEINYEIAKLIAIQNNVFISRPWNFSNLWKFFLGECLSEGEIISVEINHSGESNRDFMTPPQDWLHHDLCLLQELLKFKRYDKLDYLVEWTKSKSQLDIAGIGVISVRVSGGLSAERSSTFEVRFRNNTKMIMDMSRNKCYKFNSTGEVQEFEFTNKNSLFLMVNYFVDLNSNLIENKEEEKLQILDLLSFQ